MAIKKRKRRKSKMTINKLVKMPRHKALAYLRKIGW